MATFSRIARGILTVPGDVPDGTREDLHVEPREVFRVVVRPDAEPSPHVPGGDVWNEVNN